MFEIIAIAALFAVVVYQGWFIWAQKKHFEKTEKELLDRIMTRSYAELVQGEVARKQAEPMTDEEIYERNHEQGIPV